MTKADLVQVIQEKTNCTKKDAERVLTGVFAAITDALAAGDKVTISGFGAFEVRQRNAKAPCPRQYIAPGYRRARSFQTAQPAVSRGENARYCA